MAATTGLQRASDAWKEWAPRLPWNTPVGFYDALRKGLIRSIKSGGAIYVARRDMQALAEGDIGALERPGQPIEAA